MKINDGPDLARREKEERKNIGDYMEELGQWMYGYIQNGNRHILRRVKASYQNGKATIEREDLSAEEIGIIALAGRYFRPNFPQADQDAQEEFAQYQFQLQNYLGITKPELVVKFYNDLISNVKPEHNKLIPILHTHHAQIHALKIAYDALKGKMSSPNITARAIFGLVCIEFMKLHVRLYLIEPLARTEQGKQLDWISMLDNVFHDFDFTSPHNRNSLRRKNVVDINPYQELGLQGVLVHIKEIRDEVDALKREKMGIPEESSTKDSSIKIASTEYLRIINSIRQRFGKRGI